MTCDRMLSDRSGHRIVAISDTCIGYGSPQIPSFVISLQKAMKAEAVLFDADQPERPEVTLDKAGFPPSEFRVIRTPVGQHSHSTPKGREERAQEILAFCETFHPDVMVFFQWYFLVVFREYIKKHRPFLILYALEHSNGDENGYVCLQGPRDVAPYVDMIVFAEENRARLELPRLGLDSQKTDVVLLHNSRIYPKECRTVLPEARTGDFFYGGRLRKKQNYGEWFLKEDIQKYKIDFYGLFGEFSKDEEVLIREGNAGRIRYHGYIPSGNRYFSILSSYFYSLVLWAPLDEGTRYACPNKLYDALACGVPFITGPILLATELVEKFHCGIIMDSWDYTAFCKALTYAEAIKGSSEYAQMVYGCWKAMQEECSWSIQFDRKIIPLLASAELIPT